jgi:hypothetical protein
MGIASSLVTIWDDTMKVLTYQEAANQASINLRTLQREFSLGRGPATVALSARRRGVLEVDLDAWLISRRRAAPGEKAA